MALLWVDGFDAYGSTVNTPVTPSGIVDRRYTVSGSTPYVRDPRIAGNGRSIELGYELKTPALTTDATLIVGWAFKIITPVAAETYILSFWDGANWGIGVKLYGAIGEIAVNRHEATNVQLGTTVGANIHSGCWTYVEVKVVCGDAGSLEVRVNGVSKLTFSGDTKSGYITHTYHDKILIENDLNVYVDDLYICDGSGSKNNDFLGPQKVVTVYPSADVGGKVEWTPSSGVDHYALVDENPCTNDTDYVEDGTSGHLDQFEFSNVGSALTAVKGVGLQADCRETGASDFTLIQRAERTSVSEGSAIAIAPKGYVSTTQEGGGGLNEIQQVNLTADYGTFTLTFDGQTTTAIAYGATTTTVRLALEALSNIAPGDVAVTGVAGAWIVEFTGIYANTNVPEMILTMTDYDTHSRIMENDTEGVDWTPTNVDATQFGIKVG